MSFLEGIYNGQAETLPDARDEILDMDLKVIQVQQFPDPYAQALSEEATAAATSASAATSSVPKKKKKRLRNKSCPVNPDRVGLEERFLPPGTMLDIYELMKASEPGVQPVGFATFWRTWRSEFSHLKFRPMSSHSCCSICLKHKLLMKEMSHHVRARIAQRELYARHLQNQYLDRVAYWNLRSSARLRTTDLVMMIDSCDQAKFCYPRGPHYRSKELCTMNRPRSHITAILCHGRFILFAVSKHNFPKNSSTMTELLAHALTLAQRDGADLSRTELSIQSDNTTREMKNNTLLKWLSSLVSNSAFAYTTTIIFTIFMC